MAKSELAAKNPNLSAQEMAKMRRLASAVGDFVRYWGFRRIHGQIWTLLYLSSYPLSGADLVRRLRVSKALVSPALAELEEYGLIRQQGGDAKTKLYTAVPDVCTVIRDILIAREKKLIAEAEVAFAQLEQMPHRGSQSEIAIDRMMFLGQMIGSAHSAIDLIIQLSRAPNVQIWQHLRREVQ